MKNRLLAAPGKGLTFPMIADVALAPRASLQLPEA
jgi:hypothetical protein